MTASSLFEYAYFHAETKRRLKLKAASEATLEQQ
jgi:hypothetical protein